MAAQDATQDELSRVLKISRPRVSDLARRQLAKFSIDTLVDLLLRAGKHVEIRVA
jgi:predicted XRE-type DNA-binding protein